MFSGGSFIDIFQYSVNTKKLSLFSSYINEVCMKETFLSYNSISLPWLIWNINFYKILNTISQLSGSSLINQLAFHNYVIFTIQDQLILRNEEERFYTVYDTLNEDETETVDIVVKRGTIMQCTNWNNIFKHHIPLFYIHCGTGEDLQDDTSPYTCISSLYEQYSVVQPTCICEICWKKGQDTKHGEKILSKQPNIKLTKSEKNWNMKLTCEKDAKTENTKTNETWQWHPLTQKSS